MNLPTEKPLPERDTSPDANLLIDTYLVKESIDATEMETLLKVLANINLHYLEALNPSLKELITNQNIRSQHNFLRNAKKDWPPDTFREILNLIPEINPPRKPRGKKIELSQEETETLLNSRNAEDDFIDGNGEVCRTSTRWRELLFPGEKRPVAVRNKIKDLFLCLDFYIVTLNPNKLRSKPSKLFRKSDVDAIFKKITEEENSNKRNPSELDLQIEKATRHICNICFTDDGLFKHLNGNQSYQSQLIEEIKNADYLNRELSETLYFLLRDEDFFKTLNSTQKNSVLSGLLLDLQNAPAFLNTGK